LFCLAPLVTPKVGEIWFNWALRDDQISRRQWGAENKRLKVNAGQLLSMMITNIYYILL